MNSKFCLLVIFFCSLMLHTQAVSTAEPSSVDLSKLSADAVINTESSTYDSHPSAITLSDGTTCVAWTAFKESRDQILLRFIAANGTPGPLQTVSQEGSVHGHPTVVSLNETDLWVLWSAKRPEGWRILGRLCRSTAIRVSEHVMTVAWSGLQQSRFRIQTRPLQGVRWLPPRTESDTEGNAFRPALAFKPDGNIWLVWDQYEQNHYRVVGRNLSAGQGPIEAISPTDMHCLQPTLLYTDQGLYAAWLQKQDVVGGPGVVSQWHTLHGDRLLTQQGTRLPLS